MKILSVAWAVAGAGILAAAVSAAPAGDPSPGDPYALETCPVSGGKLGSMGDPVVRQYDGREVRFCCGGCIGKYEKDKAGYLKKIDEAIVKQQLPLYPLDTCLVSGEKLGDKPVDFVTGNRLVRLGGPDAVKEFQKDPGKHLAKLDAAAIEKQKASYALKTCVVTGEKLGEMGEPVDVVVAGRLLRLCCKGCIGKVRKDPLKYLGAPGKGGTKIEPPKSGHQHQSAPAGGGCCGGHP